jgi:hypothetical protein
MDIHLANPIRSRQKLSIWRQDGDYVHIRIRSHFQLEIPVQNMASVEGMKAVREVRTLRTLSGKIDWRDSRPRYIHPRAL